MVTKILTRKTAWSLASMLPKGGLLNTAKKVVTSRPFIDRAGGALMGAASGSGVGAMTGNEGAAGAGLYGGAALGGLMGASGSRMPRGLLKTPAMRQVNRVAGPAMRNAAVGTGVGMIADDAAGAMGYNTNFTAMGALAGGTHGAMGRILRNPIHNTPGTQTAGHFLTGAARPYAQMADKVSQGWNKLQGKPAGAKPFSASLGAAPDPGMGRAAHNLGYAASAVPIAAGAYGMAGALGNKAVEHVADVAGNALENRFDQFANERLPQMSQYVQDQADQYLDRRVPNLMNYAGQYAQHQMPGLLNQGVDQLQQRGVLGPGGGVRLQAPNPLSWISSLYHRYAGSQPATGAGYH